MNNSTIFKKAHALAKAFLATLKSYRAAFSAALRKVYADIKKPVIVSVVVEWSESYNFEDNTTYTLEEYSARAHKTKAEQVGDDYGYDKTKVTAIYSNGMEYSFRHDIGCCKTDISARMSEAARYSLAAKPDTKLRAFYELIA